MNIIPFPDTSQKTKNISKKLNKDGRMVSDYPRFLTRQGRLASQNSLFRLAQLSQIIGLIDQLQKGFPSGASSKAIISLVE